MPKPERFLQRSSPASIAEGKSLKMTQGNHAGQQNSPLLAASLLDSGTQQGHLSSNSRHAGYKSLRCALGRGSSV